MARTIADQLVAQLIDAGVDHIYGIVGDSLNPIVDAVRRSGGKRKGGIDWIHVRHEETAAFMAAAEAQLTGQIAVCAGSCGPGNLHLINGSTTRIARVPGTGDRPPHPKCRDRFGLLPGDPSRAPLRRLLGYCEQISHGRPVPRVVNSALRHSLAGPAYR